MNKDNFKGPYVFSSDCEDSLVYVEDVNVIDTIKKISNMCLDEDNTYLTKVHKVDTDSLNEDMYDRVVYITNKVVDESKQYLDSINVEAVDEYDFMEDFDIVWSEIGLK